MLSYVTYTGISRSHQALFSIEQAYVFQYYFNWKKADEAKNQAVGLSGLEINLTGRNLVWSASDDDREDCRATRQTNSISSKEHFAVTRGYQSKAMRPIVQR